MECLLCQREFEPSIALSVLVSFRPLYKETICQNCRKNFESIGASSSHRCQGCLKKLSSRKFNKCEDCQNWAKKYPHIAYRHHALFYYNEIAKEWLHRYKFLRDYRLKNAFSESLYRFYRHHTDFRFVPIPLSANRLEERGYNQVSALLEAAGIPYDLILKKNTNSFRQSQRRKLERIEMVQPFQLNDDVCIKAKKIMIIDDIYTTGSTIYHALDVFSQVGVTKMEGFTLFR